LEVIVLLTIHGIGFQRAPTGLAKSDGYADALHEHLRAHLGDLIGDDPNRAAAGGRGPVYVQSSVPPFSSATEPGVGRLGSWTSSGSVDAVTQPLAAPNTRIAHVALVYSGLEEQQGDVPALLGMQMISATSLGDYATFGGLAQMAFRDLDALRLHPPGDGTPAPSLQPRSDTTMHRGIVQRLTQHVTTNANDTSPTGPSGILHTVEDDVAAYVTRNEHRERVRSFVRDAACRLIARPDVEGLVVNGHSNGTVMGFDLIAALSPPTARNIRAFVTSGCPLRKYVDLLDWGRDAGGLRSLRNGWINFWDPLDPVADPLGPPSGWKRGQPVPAPGPSSMFVVYDPTTGAPGDIAVSDRQVNNVVDSLGGGLRAHNYWDNDAFAAGAAPTLEEAAH
jgi:hypothetical protein